ncbi:MAG: RNA polymerase sigma factor [Pseudomonadota bacterium]
MDDLSKIFLSLRVNLARVASRIVPPDEVEDIVQESYVRLYQVDEAEKIRHPQSYMFRIVRNLALDHVKRADQRLNTSISDESFAEDALTSPGDSTYTEVASKEEFALFCDAVRDLPLQCRKVFVLKKVYNYSQKEISSELGISQSTVEKHIALGIRRCAQYMKVRTADVADGLTQPQIKEKQS